MDIEKEQHKILNKEWFEQQKTPLKTLICYPVLVNKEVVGTITLITGYKHEFITSDITFIEDLSCRLAIFKKICDYE